MSKSCLEKGHISQSQIISAIFHIKSHINISDNQMSIWVVEGKTKYQENILDNQEIQIMELTDMDFKLYKRTNGCVR